MREKILVLALLFLAMHCCGQKEDYNWIFNWSSADFLSPESLWNGSILSFNSLPPEILKNSDIDLDFDKSNAIVSDSLGNIILYSNGEAIYGANHKPIFNGDTINYSPIWSGFTFPNEIGEIKPLGFPINNLISILPCPSEENCWVALYQNFEHILETGFYELWYSKIVKNVEYEVVEKDIVLQKELIRRGMVSACKHANGRDWWILQGQQDSVLYFLFNQDGLKLHHKQKLPQNLENNFGQVAFNKEGTAFAYFGTKNQIVDDEYFDGEIFYADFDRCSGLLENIHRMEYNGKLSVRNNGIAFSGNGQYLYISESERIIQFDLSKEDFFSKPIVVGEWDGFLCDFGSAGTGSRFGIMQRGPDDRIYISGSNQCLYVHVINNPDMKGTDCDFEQRAIRLESFHIGTVPTFNTLRLGPLNGSPCDTLGLDNNPVSKFWYEQDNTDH